MNSLSVLLLVVVVGVVAPVQGRSALSQVLDVVGELQTTGFGNVQIPKYSEARTNKALANMAKLFETTRQVIVEASKPGALQPAGPDALKQLELMERVIPLSIKIVGDLASRTADDPMLEPALPDYSSSGVAPQRSYVQAPATRSAAAPATATYVPKYNNAQTKRALANMEKLFQTTRQVIVEASKPGALQPAGPNALKQLELMETVIPLSLNIVSNLAAQTADDPMVL